MFEYLQSSMVGGEIGLHQVAAIFHMLSKCYTILSSAICTFLVSAHFVITDLLPDALTLMHALLLSIVLLILKSADITTGCFLVPDLALRLTTFFISDKAIGWLQVGGEGDHCGC
jgi:hypothetical protein